jgi:hypothetical protein
MHAPLPAQHPLQLAAEHAPEPSQVPLTLQVWEPVQEVQAAPAAPQADAAEPTWHLPDASQQPLQVLAEQVGLVPATHALRTTAAPTAMKNAPKRRFMPCSP